MDPHEEPHNIQQAVPFLSVDNLAESLRFYVDGLGFRIADKWMDQGSLRWCWLTLGGASIMLQEFSKGRHDTRVPAGRVGAGLTIYFICKDALAVYRDTLSRGVQPSQPFVGNSMWVVSMKDPDGYSICFESATEVPEGTVFTI